MSVKISDTTSRDADRSKCPLCPVTDKTLSELRTALRTASFLTKVAYGGLMGLKVALWIIKLNDSISQE